MPVLCVCEVKRKSKNVRYTMRIDWGEEKINNNKYLVKERFLPNRTFA